MIRLEKINGKNYRECIKLEPKEDQKCFVATNVYSLAQAYISLVEKNSTLMPYAVFNDETMVGFIMMEYYIENGESIYEIGRLMIDKNHQGKGYGKDTMIKAIDIIKEFPCGPAKQIGISYIPNNNIAKKLYASLGFEETGKMEGDEVCASLEL